MTDVEEYHTKLYVFSLARPEADDWRSKSKDSVRVRTDPPCETTWTQSNIFILVILALIQFLFRSQYLVGFR